MTELNLRPILSEFSKEIREQIGDELGIIGEEAVKELKATSPKNKGKYAKNWRYIAEKNYGSFKLTVYNKQYQLTHLLENGHLNRDGTTRSTAKPHISAVNENAKKKFYKFLGVDE